MKNLGDQLAWYQNWKNEVKSLVGEEKGAYIIKNALNIVSTGANDWVNNYYLNPLLQKKYTPETYTTFLIGEARSYIQVPNHFVQKIVPDNFPISNPDKL